MRRFAALTIIMAAFVLSSCGGNDATPAPTPSPTLDATVVTMLNDRATAMAAPPPTNTVDVVSFMFNEAISNMLALQTYHVSAVITDNNTTIVEGDITKVAISYTISTGGAAADTKLHAISMGSNRYFRLGASGSWTEAARPADEGTITSIMNAFHGSAFGVGNSPIKDIGSDMVDNHLAHHIQLLNTGTGSKSHIGVWLGDDPKTGKIVRRIAFKNTDTTGLTTELFSTYSNFNQPMNIVAPTIAPTATDTPIVTDTPIPSPTTVVEGMVNQAFDNMGKLDSYHLTTLVISGTQQLGTDGDYSHADARYTETDPPSNPLTILVINGEVFTSDDGGKVWVKSDLPGFGDFSSVTKTILNSTQSGIKYAASMNVVGDEKIGADSVTHIHLAYNDSGADSDLWIGNDAKAGLVVYKIQETDLTYTFSNFNAPLTFATPVILPTPTYNPFHVVTYKVTGTTTTQVGLTVQNDTNGTDSITVNIPWQKSYNFTDGTFYYVAAQNQGGGGSVSCEVLVDGVHVAGSTSAGDYAIATCSGTVGN